MINFTKSKQKRYLLFQKKMNGSKIIKLKKKRNQINKNSNK